MNNTMIFGLILVIWAITGMIGVIFHDRFKYNWCMILFFLAVPFIPFIAKIFKIH